MEVIRVSSKQWPATYINEAKAKLATADSLEFHALEGGIYNAIKAADSLINYGYVTLAKFETSLLDDEESSTKNKGITKVTIRLNKSPNFTNLSEEFEKKKPPRN
jgi:hypothetical protein